MVGGNDVWWLVAVMLLIFGILVKLMEYMKVVVDRYNGDMVEIVVMVIMVVVAMTVVVVCW